MQNEAPKYVLLADAEESVDGGGCWRFAVRSDDGEELVHATDQEPGVTGTRLQLLSVVRAIESLDEPARVTLYTSSSYVVRGVRFGMPDWRRNGWRWERFGIMVPITHADLWQRLDRAMQFHQVQIRSCRIDNGHAVQPPKYLAHRAAS